MSEIGEAKAGCEAGVSERSAIFDDDDAMRLVRYLVACGYSPSQVEQAMRDLDIKDPAHG